MTLVNKKKTLLQLILLGLLFSPLQVFAKDSLSSVLAQAAKQEIVALKYHEIKHIVFLQDAVSTSGLMFLAGDQFVLEQLQPERLLISIDQQRFRFFIPQKHIYHSKMLRSPMIQKAMGLFKPLMSGDEKALKEVFETTFVVDKKGWHLGLQPKDTTHTRFKHIQLTGKPSQAAHQVLVEMSDGSTSEWSFFMQAISEQSINTMQNLLRESKGL